MPYLIFNKFFDYVCERTVLELTDLDRHTLMMIIDEKRVRLLIRDISIHQEYVPPPVPASKYFAKRHRRGDEGFMVLYDVRDETSFEVAKAKAITPHFGKVQISNAVDAL